MRLEAKLLEQKVLSKKIQRFLNDYLLKKKDSTKRKRILLLQMKKIIILQKQKNRLKKLNYLDMKQRKRQSTITIIVRGILSFRTIIEGSKRKRHMKHK
ncbi:hypothetical protein IJL65_03705 [bacterium]|nr:hypothetical protein [bacterium]